MKNLPLFPLGRRGYIFGVLNALLAIGLTVVSFRYVQPVDCYRFCGPLDGMPCPTGACRWGEQKAGWPLPVFVDAPGGGSPTGGWGLLGPEDLPLPGSLILDVLFFSLLVWLAFYAIQLVRGQVLPRKLVLATLSVNTLLAVSLWVFYLLFGYHLPIGRGQSVGVYVNTQTSTYAGSGFSPIVSVPVEELIEKYDDPNYVLLASEGTTETQRIRGVLYWESIGMFVELPQIAKNTYHIEKATDVEMIVFFDEEPVVGIDGRPLGEKKIPWAGYGSYQP